MRRQRGQQARTADGYWNSPRGLGSASQPDPVTDRYPVGLDQQGLLHEASPPLLRDDGRVFAGPTGVEQQRLARWTP